MHCNGGREEPQFKSTQGRSHSHGRPPMTKRAASPLRPDGQQLAPPISHSTGGATTIRETRDEDRFGRCGPAVAVNTLSLGTSSPGGFTCVSGQDGMPLSATCLQASSKHLMIVRFTAAPKPQSSGRVQHEGREVSRSLPRATAPSKQRNARG